MHVSPHSFHIPVMGIGYTVDAPIRVAHLGIDSVISLVDDVLLERVRERYCREYGLPFMPIGNKEEDARARRVTAYFDLVQDIVTLKMEAVRRLPFAPGNDKSRYFELLPETSPLKQRYLKMLALEVGSERAALEAELTREMEPGSIDANIMVKLDRWHRFPTQHPPEERGDAKEAARGYAESKVEGSLVLSAGVNQALFTYLTKLPGFYRDASGHRRKRIILKVSDFRSGVVQSRLLAKKGLEVYELRIESGLNCGGHAFISGGVLLPTILKEMRERRHELLEQTRPLLEKFYQHAGWGIERLTGITGPRLTVQGGIGTSGEDRRLHEVYGMDATGWATPFLLVPEVTSLDSVTRQLLADAKEEDLYLSGASPLGVPFNNVRGSGSQHWHQGRVAEGRPGSPCTRGYLAFVTDESGRLICTASREYQKKQLALMETKGLAKTEREEAREKLFEKECLCDHLGNAALIELGIGKPEEELPQAVCPGPNLAYFSKIVSLDEMVGHIYGRGPSLVPASRPHMFAKELSLVARHFRERLERFDGSPEEAKSIRHGVAQLEASMDDCLEVARSQPFLGENLESIIAQVALERPRLRALLAKMEARVQEAKPQEELTISP